MTRIIIAGDLHGHLDLLYQKAQAHSPDYIIQLGDFGAYPDPTKADSAAQKHGLPPDFPLYLSGQKNIPINTYFIKGNHEDVDFLDKKCGEIIPNLNYIPNGNIFTLDNIRFAALGGNYSQQYFHATKLPQNRRRHFTKIELDRLKKQPFDILLLHNGPYSESLPEGCQELTDFIEQTHPHLVYHGHHHHFYTTVINKTKVIGLAKIDGHQQSIIIHE